MVKFCEKTEISCSIKGITEENIKILRQSVQKDLKRAKVTFPI